MQPLRFGVLDLLLAMMLIAYFCGVVTLGLADVGTDVLKVIEFQPPEFWQSPVFIPVIGFILIIGLFVYLFALMTSPVWFVAAILSSTLRPKLFLLASVLAVLVALVLPILLKDGYHQISLMVCLSLGAMPLGSAWIFHRWLLGLETSFLVNFWFFGMFVVQLSVIQVAGVLHAMAYY
ncbi:hypothetical protein DTL42_08870 [Bremerella cremea]|uniref:Uncharacterized protein n=1 Tax=Bremerella cremea TaxID=1031537 RepID=A0A368KW19_9BACT|nr:hypothetical protein DTL42_08870 [Bremerella cremea]